MTALSFPDGHVITGAEWAQFQDFLNPQYVRKTSAESVTSSTVLQDDDDLYLTVKANAVYYIRAFLIYTGVAAGDFKFGWTAPTGSAFDWHGFAPDIAITTNAGNVIWLASTLTDAIGCGIAGGSPYQVCRPNGCLRVGSVGGTFRLQWAQGTSNVSSTDLRPGSFLAAYRIS